MGLRKIQGNTEPWDNHGTNISFGDVFGGIGGAILDPIGTLTGGVSGLQGLVSGAEAVTGQDLGGPLGGTLGGQPGAPGFTRTITPSESFEFGAGTLAPSQQFQEAINRQRIFGPQRAEIERLLGFTGGLLGRFGQRPEQLVAGFSPLQQAGQQAAIGALGPTAGLIGQAQRGFGQALGTDVAQNPFFQSSLQAAINPFIRSFQQEVLPSLRGQAIGVGQPGGSREQIAQGLATQGLLGQIGDIASRMGQQAFGQTLQARQQALGLAPQLAQLGLLPAQTLMGIGEQQRALEQQRLAAPFTLGQNIQGLLGTPITLGEQISRGGSIGAITGPTFGTTRGAVTEQLGPTLPTPGLLEQVGGGLGSLGLNLFAPGTSLFG